MHIDETASNVTRIFDSDRERTLYVNQMGEEHHIINKQKKSLKESGVMGFKQPPEQYIGLETRALSTSLRGSCRLILFLNYPTKLCYVP